jgi:hypothetical protein
MLRCVHVAAFEKFDADKAAPTTDVLHLRDHPQTASVVPDLVLFA